MRTLPLIRTLHAVPVVSRIALYDYYPLTWSLHLLLNDLLHPVQWCLRCLTVEYLKRVHILWREEIVQGANVLTNLHKQPAITTAHLSQTQCWTYVQLQTIRALQITGVPPGMETIKFPDLLHGGSVLFSTILQIPQWPLVIKTHSKSLPPGDILHKVNYGCV